jgi:hypothetical protein
VGIVINFSIIVIIPVDGFGIAKIPITQVPRGQTMKLFAHPCYQFIHTHIKARHPGM